LDQHKMTEPATITPTRGDNPMEPLDHIKRNRKLNTKLLVTFPLQQRIGLAEMSHATEVSQQELIRRAIGAMLADFDASAKKLQAPSPMAKKKVKSQTHSTPASSFISEPKQADGTRPPQPSPDHVWVVRGTGGYWRAKAGMKR
jgi:hypothetical protein